MLDEPLSPLRAKQLMGQILASGRVVPSRHALDELAKDDMDMQDVINVVRGGAVDPADLVDGTWRYRVRTQRMAVVVAFRSETEMRIVTAWRYKR